jgi:phosphatidylserine/phosphatidylglycerophosphate/cardiolipin synthase-like enzyme
MILSSHVILGALSDAVHAGSALDFAGIYDRTQMDDVARQWKKSSHNSGLVATFEEVASHLAGKKSTPYRPDSPHDFMHNKIVICDDLVITGSFNFSRSAAQNAEKCLFISDAPLAQPYGDYIDKLVSRYGAVHAVAATPG